MQQALGARNVWNALKLQAGKPGVQFKFLKPHELQDFIEQKAKNGFGAEGKKKKVKHASKPSQIAVEIDPNLLAFHAGHFQDSVGVNLPQLALGEAVVNARGLAICSKRDALPFMEEATSMSTDALGLLVTSEFLAEEKGPASVSSVRFPATYLATQEQVIINGSLVSLGDIAIKRHVSTGPGKVSEVTATQVIRLQVYRDELASDWDQFCAAPIKMVVNWVPQLQLCDGVGCGAQCKRCHAPVEIPCSQVLLEVWARRFHSMEGKTCNASQSECFAAFLRIAMPAKDAVLKVTLDGIYFEPRAENPPGPDRDFAVVWLPQMSRQEVLHKLRTTAGATALVRLKTKYGVRVASKDEEQVHSKLRPEVSFFKMAITKTFIIQPLPHGVTRGAVEEILSEWKWAARPLQPIKGNFLGTPSLIGSEMDPPAPVLSAYDRDIIINPAQQKMVKVKSLPPVQASRKTQQHIQAQGNGQTSKPKDKNTYPWSNGADPWAAYI